MENNDELLLIGIDLICKCHAGILDLNCATCDDNQKYSLCCSGNLDNPVYIDDELGEFYTCPIKFISSRVYEFIDEYNYYQVFAGSAPKYTEVSNRFWDLCKIYKHKLNKYEEQKRNNGDKPKESETKNSLYKLRQGFKK